MANYRYISLKQLILCTVSPPHFHSAGYDHEFVDEVPQKYICPICMKVLSKARLAECCGQHYCESCLAQWFRSYPKKICPHCRCVNFQHVVNKEKIREINEFRIRCTNSAKGCEWVGELQAIKNHLDSENGCRWVRVKCSNKGHTTQSFVASFSVEHVICGAEMERGYLADHCKNQCNYRQYTCEYCGYVDTYDAIAGSGKVRNPYSNATHTNHYGTCVNYPLKCVNECGKRDIRRKDVQSHKGICPLEKINCPFDSRCRGDILRKDMEIHKKDCDFRPHTCEYCGHVGAFYTMSGRGKYWMLKYTPSHYETCGYYPLECVNKCGEREIKRKDMNDHCNVCPMQQLICPYLCIRCKILRKDMNKHKNEECENRPYTCQYCNACGTYKLMNGKGEGGQCHYNICDHYPLDCPNKCGARNIKRKNMSLHRAKCVLEPLNCPYEYTGCKTLVPRKEMDNHCVKNTQNHLLLMAKSHHELRVKNEELARKNEMLTKTVDRLVMKSEELERKVDKLIVEVARKSEATTKPTYGSQRLYFGADRDYHHYSHQ